MIGTDTHLIFMTARAPAEITRAEPRATAAMGGPRWSAGFTVRNRAASRWCRAWDAARSAN